MGRKAQGKISAHHIVPTSRRGKRVPENELHINGKFHNAWHVLFGNLFVEEAITIIKYCWQDGQGQIKERYLLGEMKEIKIRRKTFVVDKRLLAWQTIFGDIRSAEDAIKIIQEIFIRKRT